MSTRPPGSDTAASLLRVVPQQSRGIRKLVTILDAADQIMTADGWQAVTTTRVAQQAGVSVGTLYRYLPHRDAILDALTERYLGDLARRIDELTHGRSSSIRRRSGVIDTADRADEVTVLVDRVITCIADFYRRNPGFCALRFFGPVTDQLSELDRGFRESVSRSIVRLARQGGYACDTEDAANRCEVIQLAINGVITEAFRVDPRGDQELLDHLVIMISGFVRTTLDVERRELRAVHR